MRSTGSPENVFTAETRGGGEMITMKKSTRCLEKCEEKLLFNFCYSSNSVTCSIAFIKGVQISRTPTGAFSFTIGTVLVRW